MSYGYGTHSYYNSTEHRQMHKERAQATAEFLAQPEREIIPVGPICRCAQMRYEHKPHGMETAQQVAQFYRWTFGEVRTRAKVHKAEHVDKKSVAAGGE